MSMAPGGARRRGQPLVALAALLAGWVALRAVAWMPGPAAPEPPVLAAAPDGGSPPIKAEIAQGLPPWREVAAISEGSAAHDRGGAAAVQPAPRLVRAPQPRLTGTLGTIAFGGSGSTVAPPASSDPAGSLSASKQSVLPGLPTPLAGRGSRWSGDGWVLYRRGSGVLAAAAGLFPTYGASQAGGVIRYALDPASARAPHAYLRVNRAIDFAQSETAAGLSLRPLPGVPVRVLGEARLQRDAGRTRLRPAASVISELPPVRLPLGAQGELYAQAGYVAGKRATPFFDAQATVERPLLAAGPAELRFGAGAWAGGQKGSARLDLGPRASLKLALGEASSRFAFDWRFRVAGNARPDSGPAVTFSAGF